jgi:hypothetical protein
VGALQTDTFGEDALQSAINATYDGSGFSSAQLQNTSNFYKLKNTLTPGQFAGAYTKMMDAPGASGTIYTEEQLQSLMQGGAL